MKNEWEQIDDHTIKIWLQERDGERLYTLIDADDFDLVNSYNVRWYALGKKRDRLYAVAHFMVNGKRCLIRLYRIIMGVQHLDFKSGVFVDHINPSATLDNRKSNLRIVNPKQNGQNKELLSNNISGFRGVFYRKSKRSKPWEAAVIVDKKYHFLGLYATPEEAAKVATEFRSSHMPFSTADQMEVNQPEQ